MTQIDLSKTIAPKSDQLNADDLIGGPRTITVTSVRLAAEDQPVSIHFVGDEGKPYKPCKSMRRVLVKAWGPDGSKYAGRSMTLYMDETVRFGGAAVGGIRISHLSHIDRQVTMALTATRAKKVAYTVGVISASAEEAHDLSRDAIIDELESAAREGRLQEKWASLTKHQRLAVGQEEIARIKNISEM